ncbi:hypothetical protein Pmani_011483 [Petrolisthes manimaculis]|uniref:Uncharacterized protein n=1 Tax=Petrolisthes manimaculis TaxID=1843537 RepID=A0AAE1UEE0_9EUCA|nr:hypothetical protein Pmani_011483 [Petrolisthes manimaculis]
MKLSPLRISLLAIDKSILMYVTLAIFLQAAHHTCLSVSRVFSPSGWWGNPEVWVESEWMEGGWRQLDGRVLHWDLSGGPISASLVCVVRVPGPGPPRGGHPSSLTPSPLWPGVVRMT